MPSEDAIPHNRKPFHCSAERAIVHFIIALYPRWRKFELVVHRKALLALLSSRASVSGPPDLIRSTSGSLTSIPVDVEDVPWSNWGPPICRWFDTSGTTTRYWITCSTGERYVSIPSFSPVIGSVIRVYDFNLYRIRRGDGTSICREATVLGEAPGDIPNPFDEDVRSELPYMLTTSSSGLQYSGVMMDEERIIGLRVSFMPLYVRSNDFNFVAARPTHRRYRINLHTAFRLNHAPRAHGRAYVDGVVMLGGGGMCAD
jgi:hypothetical protein